MSEYISNVVIIVDDHKPDNKIDEAVLKRLQDYGFFVTTCLHEQAVVMGDIPQTKLSGLSLIDGVGCVRTVFTYLKAAGSECVPEDDDE